jgi:hypothetical protein
VIEIELPSELAYFTKASSYKQWLLQLLDSSMVAANDPQQQIKPSGHRVW